jgi:hypothetical protein
MMGPDARGSLINGQRKIIVTEEIYQILSLYTHSYFPDLYILKNNFAIFKFDITFICKYLFKYQTKTGAQQTLKIETQNMIEGVTLILSASQDESNIKRYEMKKILKSQKPFNT